MTRKHFQAIASILRDNLHAYPETAEDHAENYRVRAIAADLSSYLRGQNPRFDRDRFLEAAGCNARITEDGLVRYGGEVR